MELAGRRFLVLSAIDDDGGADFMARPENRDQLRCKVYADPGAPLRNAGVIPSIIAELQRAAHGEHRFHRPVERSVAERLVELGACKECSSGTRRCLRLMKASRNRDGLSGCGLRWFPQEEHR